MRHCIIYNHRNRAVFNWVSKVIAELLWFCFTSLCEGFKKLAPPIQPIRCKTKTNRFPALGVGYVCLIWFDFSLVHCVVYYCCDWPLFWFYDTQLKTALRDQSFQTLWMRDLYIRFRTFRKWPTWLLTRAHSRKRPAIVMTTFSNSRGDHLWELQHKLFSKGTLIARYV